MGTTPVKGFRYPDSTSPPDGPLAFRLLAEDVEGALLDQGGSVRPLIAAAVPGQLFADTATERVWIATDTHWVKVGGSDTEVWNLADSGSTPNAVGPGGGTNVQTGTAVTPNAEERLSVRGYVGAWVNFPTGGGSTAGYLYLRLGGVNLVKYRLHSQGVSGRFFVGGFGDASITGGSSLTPNIRVENDSGSVGNISLTNMSARIYY